MRHGISRRGCAGTVFALLIVSSPMAAADLAGFSLAVSIEITPLQEVLFVTETPVQSRMVDHCGGAER